MYVLFIFIWHMATLSWSSAAIIKIKEEEIDK